MDRHLLRRSLCPLLDATAWTMAWWAAAVVAIVLVGGLPSFSDSPGEAMLVGIALGFVASWGLLLLVEAVTSRSAGRLVTRLRLIGRAGEELSRRRRALRALAKYGAIAGLLAVGQVGWYAIDPYEQSRPGLALVPLGLAVLANAVCCLARADGRSLLDLAIGSRSVRAI